jgi:hypothetical protein
MSRDRKMAGYYVRLKIQALLRILDINNQRLPASGDYYRSWLFADLIYPHTTTATPDELSLLAEKDRKPIQQLKLAAERLIKCFKRFGYTKTFCLTCLFNGLYTGVEDEWQFRSMII